MSTLQTHDQPNYAGSDFLVRIESSLKKYNRSIVKAFVRGASARTQLSKVLDFGAGIGTLSVIFQELTGTKPEGVELDTGLAEVMGSRGFVTHSSVAETSEKFDLIFTSNVLEHIPDDKEVLRELRGKLRPNGVIAIYVPAFKILWSSLDDAVGHYRRYSKGDLATKLRESGFVVFDSRYADSAGFFVTLLFKMIGGKQSEPSAKSLQFFDRYILPVSEALDTLMHPFFGKNVIAFAGLDPNSK